MKAVGIKLLKNQLSRYLDAVRKGEHIWVMDRDEVIAEIHKPLSPLAGKVSRWEAFLNEEERAGRLQRAARDHSLVRELKLSPVKLEGGLREILDEVRADRV